MDIPKQLVFGVQYLADERMEEIYIRALNEIKGKKSDIVIREEKRKKDGSLWYLKLIIEGQTYHRFEVRKSRVY